MRRIVWSRPSSVLRHVVGKRRGDYTKVETENSSTDSLNDLVIESSRSGVDGWVCVWGDGGGTGYNDPLFTTEVNLRPIKYKCHSRSHGPRGGYVRFNGKRLR